MQKSPAWKFHRSSPQNLRLDSQNANAGFFAFGRAFHHRVRYTCRKPNPMARPRESGNAARMLTLIVMIVGFGTYCPNRCHWGTDATNCFTKASSCQRQHFTEELRFLSENDKGWMMGRATPCAPELETECAHARRQERNDTSWWRKSIPSRVCLPPLSQQAHDWERIRQIYTPIHCPDVDDGLEGSVAVAYAWRSPMMASRGKSRSGATVSADVIPGPAKAVWSQRDRWRSLFEIRGNWAGIRRVCACPRNRDECGQYDEGEGGRKNGSDHVQAPHSSKWEERPATAGRLEAKDRCSKAFTVFSAGGAFRRRGPSPNRTRSARLGWMVGRDAAARSRSTWLTWRQRVRSWWRKGSWWSWCCLLLHTGIGVWPHPLWETARGESSGGLAYASSKKVRNARKPRGPKGKCRIGSRASGSYSRHGPKELLAVQARNPSAGQRVCDGAAWRVPDRQRASPEFLSLSRQWINEAQVQSE